MIKKLFSANPARIGRFDGPPTSDAVPASLVDGTPGDLKSDLIALLGKENVLHRAIDLVTISKIEGRARGGGSEIALAVDMCFAAVGKAIFGHPEVAVGLVPGG